ncbi:MAG: type II toxin-antitoxin system RelB/DinJ family antitoxin [Sulfuricurvum sp.]|jgi:DNA-damage-inducible protein J|uniref:type II toxin-antitoxin system RelB/DinJ family antitoxin n=1 Tax=Sulfuricurvum sp. TaxID=2025608 RepID=UPI0025EC537B|nr:type II toxin-antitoxin system RelB/DinJ family antitoxin [Sulfuricurvum sp.]MCK9372078.1 type II toxin-antitoxin system RelB/DinJ family antitoxin [Sulfuricurvum sp.]
MRQTTSIKLDPAVKQEAQKIFNELGLSLGEAVNLFLNQVRLRKGIPFDIEIPNEETQAVMRDVLEGKNLESFSLDDLKKERKTA